MTLEQDVIAALERHPDITSVRLVGSRAGGRTTPLSDWDFAVEARRFEQVAADVAELVAPLDPLASQWDPFGRVQTFMLMLRGPVKVDLIFDEPLEERRPWDPRTDDPAAIDSHFWDWILWLGAKGLAGRDDLVVAELEKMHRHLLGPLGVEMSPASIERAVGEYAAAAERLGWDPSVLGREVCSALRRAGYLV